MKLNQIQNKVKTQPEMIKIMEGMLDAVVYGTDKNGDPTTKKTKPGTKLYQKSGTFDARKGKAGEKITTVIDGEEETQNTVKDGEIVVKGPKGEFYIISEKKFRDRYEVTSEPADKFQKYKAIGMIRAYEYTGPSFKFMASWGEEMLCNSTDFLACPVKNASDRKVVEVYRIERSVFDETYTEAS